MTNGSLFASGVDGRSAEARRFADVLAQIVSDMGGSEHLSEGQRQLARRAAMIAVACEKIEAEAVAAGSIGDEKLETFGRLTDRLGRCFQRLGLRRVARDVTPRLADILAGRA